MSVLISMWHEFDEGHVGKTKRGSNRGIITPVKTFASFFPGDPHSLGLPICLSRGYLVLVIGTTGLVGRYLDVVPLDVQDSSVQITNLLEGSG